MVVAAAFGHEFPRVTKVDLSRRWYLSVGSSGRLLLAKIRPQISLLG